MSNSNYFLFSPKSAKRSATSIHPSVNLNNDLKQDDISKINRSRSDSLEKQTIHNTSILNFNGNIYNCKLVDVDEFNVIQIIFKFNNQYNLWKCKMNFKKTLEYDEKLANIYLKSFINTIQIVKCFNFDKSNYLLIDIIDKERRMSGVNFIHDKSYFIANNKFGCFQKLCDSTTSCISEVVTSDVIDYDGYMQVVYNKKS
tara:strand:- start:1018 stop:1617 length:600 start_codon:yes stop_codon:yes gene_type:complete